MIQQWAVIDSGQLLRLVGAFREGSLSHADWTHEAHLAVGTWHVYEFGPVRALAILRGSIRHLNDRHGTPNSETRGYHETITRAYVCLIADVLANEPPPNAVDAVRVVMTSAIAPKLALLDYYSRERLMSIEARRGWVSSDLRPIMPPHWPRAITTASAAALSGACGCGWNRRADHAGSESLAGHLDVTVFSRRCRGEDRGSACRD